MQIKSITLNNFRCFKGEQVINLGDGVNIIHAENGAGKSNLLYAIIWCLYGDSGLSKTPISKDRAGMVYNGADSASVIIRVNTLRGEYEFTRSIQKLSTSTINNTDTLKAYKVQIDGGRMPLPRPVSFVEYILPQDLHQFFMFDGEHADDIIDPNIPLEQSMKKIFGFHYMEKSIQILNDEKSALSKQANKDEKNRKNHDNLLKERNRLIELKGVYEENLDEAQKNSDHLTKQIEDIETKLRKHAATKEKQKLRDNLQKALKNAEKEYKEKKIQGFKEFASNINLILAKDILGNITFNKDSDDSQNTKSLLVYPWDPELIQKILNEQNCICERPVLKDTELYTLIESLQEKAVPD